MNPLKEIFNTIIKLRLHVAAIFFFVAIQIIEGTYKGNYRYYLPVIVAFTIWHYALYLFDRAYDAHLDSLNNSSESLKGNFRKLFLYFSIFLAFFPIAILWYYNFSILPYLFFIPITFLYNLRIFSNYRAVKHFTAIKNLYSAILIWPLPIAVILKYYIGFDNYLLVILSWYWSFISYVFMGEVIWDMRDTEGDMQEGIQTIPVVYGLKKTRYFLFTILTIVSFLNYIQYHSISYVLISFFSIYILISSPKLPKWLFHFPLFVSLFYYIYVYILS